MYTAIITFHIQICSSLYYPCLAMTLSKKTVQAVPIVLSDRLACHTLLILCLFFFCRYECQYGLKDRFDKTLNVTPDMKHGPRKYNIKVKNIPNRRGKSHPQFTWAKNRKSKKKDCQCRFNVKYLYYVRDIVEIVYYSMRYANKDGLVVHGKLRSGDVPSTHCRNTDVDGELSACWSPHC